MPSEVHVGDIGTVFEATFRDETGSVVNIALANVKQLRFKKPSGTVVTKTAVLSGDGSDGKARYVSVLNDLDTAGGWQVQGYVEIGAGKWSSDVYRFRVYSNVV